MDSLWKLYHVFEGQLSGLCEWKRPEHPKTLAWLMVGIFHNKDVRLDRIGSGLPLVAKPESIGQRFRRWLKNVRIDERLVYDRVARTVLERLRCRRLRIQIDRVQIKKRHNVLVMSVYYRKRAVPLAWICLPHSGSSAHAHWVDLLDYLEAILPQDARVIILADREFGSVGRLRYVQTKGWDYAIRLKGKVEFYDPQWKQPVRWLALRDVALEPGTQHFLTRVRLTKGALFPVHVACAWALGSDDPWFIATNRVATTQTLKEYARRFACEELFSDMKRRGFNWGDTLLRHLERVSRLLLAIALLIVWLLTLGRQLRLRQLDLELVSPSHRRRFSLFQIARRWLKRRMALQQLDFPLLDSLFWQLA